MGRRTLNNILVRRSWERAGLPFQLDRLLLPISPRSQHWLSQPPSPDEHVYPWSSDFRDPDAEGLFDRSSSTLALELVPERDRFNVGGPFFAEVRLTNNGKRSRKIDAELHPDCDQLRLRITRPDGQRYVHRPRESTCSARGRRLSPGQTVADSFLLIDGPQYTMLPMSGRYRIEAATSLGANAAVDVDVVDCGRKPSLPYRRYLADGAPAERQHHNTQSRKRLKAPRGQPEGLAALLNYCLGTQCKRRARLTARLNRAAGADSPKRIQEDAFVYLASVSKGDAFKRVRDRAMKAVKSPSDRFAESLGVLAERMEQ